MNIHEITDRLNAKLSRLRFSEPVTHVYNPLRYACDPWNSYLDRWGTAQKRVVLFGMNPGPWGMVQTGIPFGTVSIVRDWLGITGAVGHPRKQHPRRPVTGFDCSRDEVSGRRLWGWARDRYETPERFFNRFFVANYCPLAFFNEDGANITPDKIKTGERKPLLCACDEALRMIVDYLSPWYVIGVGRFAAGRCETALAGSGKRVGCITHPSPANPRANRGWSPVIETELKDMGIEL